MLSTTRKSHFIHLISIPENEIPATIYFIRQPRIRLPLGAWNHFTCLGAEKARE